MKSNKNIRIRKQVDRLGRPSIGMLDREIERLERKESLICLGRDFLMSLITVAAIIIIITNFWISVLQIDGSSMSPLFQKDEIVLSIKSANPIKNDVIAFNQNNKLYIKRVVAIEGDKVSIDSEGIVSVNDEILDEPYVTKLSLGNSDIEFPYIVPFGTVFVLGDNREISFDSRDSRFGPVSTGQIVGEVTFIVWPLSRAGKVF